jgi:hypothetical protein
MREKRPDEGLGRESVTSFFTSSRVSVSARALTLSHRTTTERFSLHAFLGHTHCNLILHPRGAAATIMNSVLGLGLERTDRRRFFEAAGMRIGLQAGAVKENFIRSQNR